MKIKKLLGRSLLIFGVVALALSWSVADEPYYYSEYTPVLMYRNVLEESIKYEEPRDLENPGKMYFKDDFILINEKYYGIHVIDNTDPMNPVNIGFINIPGNLDMAMRYNILYADNAVDLVAIDVSNFTTPVIKDRVKKELPELTPPGYTEVPWNYRQDNRPEDTEIIRWELRYN